MKVTAARFLGAAATPGKWPPPTGPELAIAGRSNVGKSSLINALLGRRGLARTSSTPGRTRQINFFLVNEAFVVVDLPGYGFAVGSEQERRGWGPLIEGYLRERPVLRGLVVLVDARRGPEDEERQLLDFCAHVALPAAVVATKLDKFSRGRRQGVLAGIARTIGRGDVPVLGFSSLTGDGRDALWRLLRGWLDAPPRLGHDGART
jgi:GTP-binding protein